MKIDATTPIWVVTDPTPVSTLPDICFETTLDGLRLQFAGGLSMDQRPALFTTQEDAYEEAKTRLFVWRVARQIRIDRRLPEGEIVRVTLHDRDGRVRIPGFYKDVRELEKKELKRWGELEFDEAAFMGSIGAAWARQNLSPL